MTKVVVGVGLINYKNSRFINNCLQTFEMFNRKHSYDIKIIANQCDGLEIEKMRKNRGVEVIESDKCFSHSKNTNISLSGAHGKYFLVLNDDVIFFDSTIDDLVDYLESNPNVGCVYPRLIYPDGTFQGGPADGRTLLDFFLLHTGLKGVLGRIGFYDSKKIKATKGLSGACCLMRKEVWDCVGGFDEDIPFAPNDIDLARRIAKEGFAVVYFGKKSIVHVGSGTIGIDKRSAIESHLKSLLVFLDKHYTSAQKGIAIKLFKVGMWMRFCYWLSREKADAEKSRSKGYRYYLSYLDGLKNKY